MGGYVETTIDENRLPHSPEGFKAVTWVYRRPEKYPTLVNFEHGVPTTIKDPNVLDFDFKGYPKGLEIMSYHGEVDSLLTPHGKGRINVYEGYGAFNSWTGVFNQGVLTEGAWEEEPFLRAKRAKAYRERAESGVAAAQEIEGFLRANFPASKYNVSLVSSGSEAVVSIRNQRGDFRVAIFDRNRKSAGVKARIKSITRGGNTMANQEQRLGGTYSFASSSNVQVIYMTPNDALLSSTIMRGGAESITVSLTPTSSGSYLYVYLITPKQ